MYFKFFKQHDAMDCGPACLKMIAYHYGKLIRLEKLKRICNISKEGVSLASLVNAAESLGFKSKPLKCNLNYILNKALLPCIIWWQQEHYVIVYKVTRKKIFVADPTYGKISYTKEEFLSGWGKIKENGEELGVCLILDPTNEFYSIENEIDEIHTLAFISNYLKKYKHQISQLLLSVLSISIIQMIFPFLTQALIDVGISSNDIGFIKLILIAQIFLFIGRISIEYIRSWLLLHIGKRISISILADFLTKIMKLPIAFFDSKRLGDIVQRINDHEKIEKFLTNDALNFIFSIFNIIILSLVLVAYSLKIYTIFMMGFIFAVIWIIFFLKKRRDLDYKKFAQTSAEKNFIYQLILGMQEIKLNNSELRKRLEWEMFQSKLFNIGLKGLSLNQIQEFGGRFFYEMKNILIVYYSAISVIDGNMTLGMMLSIQYIVGQLNGPTQQLITFILTYQDAKLSMERMTEIHNEKNELEIEKNYLSSLPAYKGIVINELSFKYGGPTSKTILKHININIKSNSVVAIVGSSGSGKTTLIKLLLGFYTNYSGEIILGDKKLNMYNPSWWRQQCGVVSQDGYIFSDTIENNITISSDEVNVDRLEYAIKMANIKSFIENLPLGLKTMIGEDGIGLSQGQKQRILIARAIYKDPQYLFLDEATNALDANNEKIIMDNLNDFFSNRTVVIVAHRLSTVKKADQIIVLEDGVIVESGTHSHLCTLMGRYYNLIKNQLELGN